MTRLGEIVRVRGGKFDRFIGRVSEIDESAGTAVVLIRTFGYETPIEIRIGEVDGAPELLSDGERSPDQDDPTAVLSEDC